VTGVRKKGGKGAQKKIFLNLVSRSGFNPFMWDFMRESHPKLAKIEAFIQNLQIQNRKQIKYLSHIRRLGSSEVLTENPRVPSSILGLGTRN
jgi:hypothetical protein